MEFGSASERDDFAKIIPVEAAAGKNFNSAVGAANEVCENGGAFEGGGFATGSEYACGAGRDDGFERDFKVPSFVESAVERDGERASKFDEFSRLFDANGVVAAKNSKNKAIHTAGFSERDFR